MDDQTTRTVEDSVVAELDLMREREVATREILQVISQSRADQQPVFEAVVKNAARLCDSPAGVGLHILNDKHTRM